MTRRAAAPIVDGVGEVHERGGPDAPGDVSRERVKIPRADDDDYTQAAARHVEIS